MYTGLQSPYTERTINKREPKWLYDRAKLREEHFRPEDSVETRGRLLKNLPGQGVQQQRVRDKTKEKAGTLPLTLRMIRRVRK